MTAILTMGLRVLTQAAQMVLILFPANVTGMGFRQERVPLFHGQDLVEFAAVFVLAAVHAAVKKGPGVARIVQDLQDAMVNQRHPQELTFVDAAAQAAWKEQTLLAKELNGGRRRAGAFEGGEQGADRLLDLLIGIEDH